MSELGDVLTSTGSGLITCKSADEVKAGFKQAQSRGQALFQNPGVFIERFFPEAHHIEVQVFGNGLGKAIAFGERECSVQRRHQKVIEECPSPFVQKHPGLREKLCDAAVRLAESVNYGSAGTVEFLVDDHTAEFFFLEMNTRLQVEVSNMDRFRSFFRISPLVLTFLSTAWNHRGVL